jgi:hypothetical protein
MRIRQYTSGYIYVLSTDFGPGNVVSINKSLNDPQKLVDQINKNQDAKLMGGTPFEVLYSKKFENCNVAESLVHQFLIQNDYCAVTPKDYQISLDDAVRLIEIAAETECLSHDLVLEVKHRQCLPSDATNYYMLGTMFNGQFHEDRGQQVDPFQLDELAAYSCFLKGYEYGDDRCIFELANCLENGIGVEKNLKRSLDLYDELYQMDKMAGVGGVFRVCLQDENHFKASSLLLDYFNWTDSQQDVEHKNTFNDLIETHESFTRVMANFVWDSFYIDDSFEILEPFSTQLEEFQRGICLQLDRDREALESQGFAELSAKILTCRDAFTSFVRKKGHTAA